MSLFLPIFAFVVPGILLFALFGYSIMRSRSIVVITILFAIIAEGIFFAIYTLIRFHGAFGPGILFVFLSPVMTLVILFASIILGAKILPQLNGQRRILYLLGGLLILFSQLSPLFGIFTIGSYCDSQTMQIGDRFVVAIREYQKDTGVYPPTLEALDPNYIEYEGSYNCLRRFGINAEDITVNFQLDECRGHKSLVTDSTDGVNVIWFDLTTNEWSRISFLDSDCD